MASFERCFWIYKNFFTDFITLLHKRLDTIWIRAVSRLKSFFWMPLPSKAYDSASLWIDGGISVRRKIFRNHCGTTDTRLHLFCQHKTTKNDVFRHAVFCWVPLPLVVLTLLIRPYSATWNGPKGEHFAEGSGIIGAKESNKTEEKACTYGGGADVQGQ